MRIALDARLNAYRRGGIPEYTRQLLTAMASQDRQSTFVSLQHHDQQRPITIAPNVQRHTLWTPPHHRFEQWSLPVELLLVRPDLLHCPDFVVPLRRTIPAVTTIHDLAFLHYPDILDDDARRYYGQVRASAHSADAVIAVSEATRADIATLLELPAERVDVVHEAASPEFRQIDLSEDSIRSIGSHLMRVGNFILFVSTLEPRKNLPMLLQALRICIDRDPEAIYRLAVVGARGWRYKPIFETVRDLRLEEAVLFLDSVTGDELRWLYNACRLYVNPSLYEGFGLPALEAMACGAPTLVSNTSSLPELVGDAALLLPPSEPEAWADAIDRVWNDADLRAEMSERGIAQSRRFSWQQAARETLAIYRRVIRAQATDGEAAPPRPAQASEASQVAVPLVPPLVPPPPERVRQATQPEIPFVTTGTQESAFVTQPEAPVEEVEEPIEIKAAHVPAAERSCLRCAAPLVAGELIEKLHWRPKNGLLADEHLVRAWACPICGSVELVIAQTAPEE